MESMCCVCHGPVIATQNRRTAIVCTLAQDPERLCMTVWRRMKRGEPLPRKYLHLRAKHAYRRELLATERHMMAFFARCEALREAEGLALVGYPSPALATDLEALARAEREAG